LAVPLDGNSQALTECPCERRGAEETPMGSPEGEKGFFTGAVHTSDSIQIDHHRVGVEQY
jgi:hypothetical protein